MAPSKKLADFTAALERPAAEGGTAEAVAELRADVEAFAADFPMPGPEVGAPLP